MHHTGATFFAVAITLASPLAAQAQEACPTLRWTTLGTAGGPVPTVERSEPANLLQAGELAILVDTGDGTATQLARIDRSPGDVSAIFISHLHWDHVGGLAAVLDPAGNITVVELADRQQVALGDLAVTARGNSHFDYSLEQVGTTSLSYRFDLGTRSITFSGDTGPSAALTELAQGTDMLVSEVIALEPLIAQIVAIRPDMPQPVQTAMRQHLSTHHVDAVEVGRMANSAGVGHLVLTHFAVPPGPLRASEDYLRGGVRQHYGGPLDLARDLASFDVGCD